MNLGDKEEENLISHSEENIQVSGRKLCPKEESLRLPAICEVGRNAKAGRLRAGGQVSQPPGPSGENRKAVSHW